MVSVEEASTTVFSHRCKLTPRAVPLRDAVNHVLAETITADRDFPPFDRVAMDGIAIQRSAWEQGKRTFFIEGVQAAGEPRRSLINPEHCLEVMTGAMLPENCDTVIRYEDLDIRDDIARVTTESAGDNQYIHIQGQDAKAGSILLEPGIIITPAEVALLASVGKINVQVLTFPTAAVVATGDELVDVAEMPAAHQIRRSNTYAIQAAMKTMGWDATTYHLADEKERMISMLTNIAATSEVIILSGGVSKGKFDFVPEALEAIGIKKLFHQVAQRPGKPFWFGVSDAGHTVFALPGNPVSTYMCFYRYIKPWLLRNAGIAYAVPQALLARDFSFPPVLTYFLQVNVKNENGQLVAHPDAGGGSGDFANLKNVTGFLELPPGRTSFAAGEAFPYIPFRD